MKISFGLAAVMLAATSLSLASCRDQEPKAPPSATIYSESATPDAAATAAATLLPRAVIVPASVVSQYFPGVDKEASVEVNQTSVGNAVGSISVVFTDAAGARKVTLSVDEYASAGDAAAAFATAVTRSKGAPGFKSATPPNLGEEALAGMSQVGAEKHFGLGARDGRLIMSATHAGGIPVTPENSNRLIELGRAEIAHAKKAMGIAD